MKRFALIMLLFAFSTSLLGAAERRVLILPVEFSDLRFSYGEDAFNDLADSLEAYFNLQFHGSSTFRFDIGPTASLSKSYKYYGENSPSLNDALMYRGVVEACKDVDSKVDFSNYSSSSREVNDLIILVPGRSEIDAADANLFWPQTLSLVDKDVYLVLDKQRIDHYALATELDCNGNFTGIGNIAHEYSHLLGLKDIYDTDGSGSGGTSTAMWGCTALMDKGNENCNGHLPPNYNAVDLYILGIGNGVNLENTGTYNLKPINEEGQYYILPGDVDGEVYLIECRKAEGFDAAIGGSGLLIYYVDRSENLCGWSDYYKIELTAAARWSRNQVNCNPSYQCAMLLAALPEATDVSEVFFPQEGHTSISSETDPALTFRSGNSPTFAITGISIAEDGSASFNLIKPLEITSTDIFQNSVIINWLADENLEVESSEVICMNGSDTVSITAGKALEDGNFACCVDSLQSNTEYNFIVRVHTSEGIYSVNTVCKTRPYRNRVYPFIFLRVDDRNADGSFPKGCRIPLQVFNIPDALEYRWFFDGSSISAGADGYFELTRSGELRVEAHRSDGTTDVIIKEITVK